MANLLNQINLENIEELDLAHEFTYQTTITHRKYNRPKDTIEKINRDKTKKQKLKAKQFLLQEYQDELDLES